MLLNRSLFIIGIETRLVSLCFVLSTCFYRKGAESVREREGRGGDGVGTAGTYRSGGQFHTHA